MVLKLIFIGSHLMALLAFVVVCFGFGEIVFKRALDSLDSEPLMRFGLAATFGLGIITVALQFLAILGVLTVTTVVILMLLGVFAAVVRRRQISFSCLSWHALLLPEKGALLLLIAAILRILLAPFCPPKAWDELMYHLPHALHWMETGSLTVNFWLRYPWFPYNYELLYAVAMMLYDDVFTHLLHALAGWLCALLIYQVGLKFADRAQALFATFIWLILAAEQYDNACIDMGITVFVFGAWVAMWLWWKSAPSQSGWLLGAAFLLGVAVGVKYQALSFLPLFTGLMLMRERRIRMISLTAFVFLVPCVYWYVRNAIMTGDPFNPLGGPLFGFSDWNAEDYANQIADVRSRAGKLPWLLWPASFVLIIPEARRTTHWKLAIGFGGYSILVWYAMTGGYVRYLMPAFPVLALLAARGWAWLLEALRDSLGGRLRPSLPSAWKRSLQVGITLLCIAAFFWTTVPTMKSNWKKIAVTEAEREIYLRSRISGYNVLTYLKRLPSVHVYQFGLEDAIYYAPQPIYGDHFGPWRYRDLANLPPERLASRLTEMGFDTLVIHHLRWPMIAAKPDFLRYFETIFESQGVTAYRIKT